MRKHPTPTFYVVTHDISTGPSIVERADLAAVGAGVGAGIR